MKIFILGTYKTSKYIFNLTVRRLNVDYENVDEAVLLCVNFVNFFQSENAKQKSIRFVNSHTNMYINIFI